MPVARPLEGPKTATDRRDLIRKAVVAGSLTWVTPTVLATKAYAAGCTPKCGPADFVPTITGRDACNDEEVDGVPSGNKVAIFTISVPSSSCPCGGTATVSIGPIPTEWDKNVSCTSYSSQYATGIRLSNTQFALYKNGALGNGFYIPNGSFCVAIGCTDRTGDTVWKVCSYNVCLNYTPAGACTTFTSVGVTTSNTECSASCAPCPGS
jgi:hypothetical protein